MQQHSNKLFNPINIGDDLVFQHRVAFAPCTRMRATKDGVLRSMTEEYYRQRGSCTGTLLISEATNISQQAQGYTNTPGIWSGEQIDAWKKVADAVHENQSFLFMQLWHTGRVSHPSFQPNGALPVSSSAINPGGQTVSKDGQNVDCVTPRALTVNEIKQVVEDYRKAAENAKKAGMDGIELHSANGKCQ
jgi:N-ethylmaleimide reductase